MNLAYSIFVTTVWFLSTYFSIVLLLTLLTNKDRMHRGPRFLKNEQRPGVTILVPVYNEGEKVKETIDSLKKLKYPRGKLEIIILNDGSRDNTSEVVNREIAGTDMIFVDNKDNKGKASTLNQGIDLAKHDFIATMDGDSEVTAEVLEKAMPNFKDESVGAVTVSVEVKNPKTLLQKIVEVEYVIGLTLALKALSFHDAVHVTPGPFSLYRKSVFENIGGFDKDNITEDHEIALRMHKHGYRIANSMDAVVRTISPGTFKELYVQRKRWYTGSLLSLWQYRGMMLRPKNGVFSFSYPYTYLVVTCGLVLFSYTLFLALTNLYEFIAFHSLTNFNFFSRVVFDIDFLRINGLSILGGLAVVTTAITTFICLRLVKKSVKTRIPGFVGFIFLFFLYQIFWGSSFISAISRKKVKWR